MAFLDFLLTVYRKGELGKWYIVTFLERNDKMGKASLNYVKRNVFSGILVGMGFAAFIDEFVFHQLLQWHHFYDGSTTRIGIISDGFFHAFSWFATIGGLFLFADLRRRNALKFKKWHGSFWLGTGGFQLYDGLIQHKLMGLHQIRYVDTLWIYDTIWNGLALLMIVAGIALLQISKKKQGRHSYE